MAPCFEVARSFLIARFENNELLSTRVVDCGGCEGFGRVQMLRQRQVDTLICSGIKGFYRDLLQAAGIAVVSNVSGGVSETLTAWVAGKLAPDGAEAEPIDFEGEFPLEDLVCWTRELFVAHGYRVSDSADRAPFPIDLVAEIPCPVCHRPIRVAICCGAHTYRPEREIELLHLVSAGGYDARVYVRSTTPHVAARCREYGVELIDPDSRFANRDEPVADRIPILQTVVAGHERASAGA